MKVGILQADSVLPEFQPEHGDYPGMIEEVLGHAGRELGVRLEFETYDVEHGVYPSAMSDCGGYVMTGSRKSVYDDEPWIRRLISYVQALHAARVKLVGICFGHQLAAQALGGRTVKAEAGWGVGIHASKVVRHTWFMDDVPGYNLVVSHQDQVDILPADAELLASSDFCPNSMFCVGNHIFAFQGHPEFTPAYSAALMNKRRDILGEATFEAGVASLARPLTRDLVARWSVRFLLGREYGKEKVESV